MVKYLYMLDRRALERWGFPVTNDSYDALENGPVPSRVHDLVVGDEQENLWSEYFSRDESADVVRLEKSDPEFGFLSEAEMGLVKEISEEFSGKSNDELRGIFHDLPEYKDPGEGERVRIGFEELMENIISDPVQRKTVIDELEYEGYFEGLLQTYSSSR